MKEWLLYFVIALVVIGTIWYALEFVHSCNGTVVRGVFGFVCIEQ